MKNNSFTQHITNEQIVELPLKQFDGKIIVIDNFIDLNNVIPLLKKEEILGFDTETRPTFKKGKSNINKVALLQFSTEKTAYLFRLNKIGFPPQLRDILTDKNIIKVGIAIHEDIEKLRKLNSFRPQRFVELHQLIKNFGIEKCSLKKLSAMILKIRISKHQQLSNWENPELTPAQQLYAATDAWASLMIYLTLQKI